MLVASTVNMSLRRQLDRAIASIVYESPDPFASEIALVANGVVSLLAFFAAWLLLSLGVLASALCAALLFVLLRIAFVNRIATVAAGAVSALGIAAAAGTAGWIMGHCVDATAIPEICAAICAVLGGAMPASAYRRLLRADAPRDSRQSLVPSTR